MKAGLAHSPKGRRRPGFRDEEGKRFSMGEAELSFFSLGSKSTYAADIVLSSPLGLIHLTPLR